MVDERTIENTNGCDTGPNACSERKRNNVSGGSVESMDFMGRGTDAWPRSADVDLLDHIHSGCTDFGWNPSFPLSRLEWVLLAIGLTQLHAIAGLIVVGWLLWLSWRGRVTPEKLGATQFNLLQVLLVLTTLIVFGIFLVVVAKGLLGSPEMFIVGNGSYGNNLNWFEPKVVSELPRPSIVTVSIWFYRLAMLLWALWLASALIRWLQFGWQSFSYAGRWCSK